MALRGWAPRVLALAILMALAVVSDCAGLEEWPVETLRIGSAELEYPSILPRVIAHRVLEERIQAAESVLGMLDCAAPNSLQVTIVSTALEEYSTGSASMGNCRVTYYVLAQRLIKCAEVGISPIAQRECGTEALAVLDLAWHARRHEAWGTNNSRFIKGGIASYLETLYKKRDGYTLMASALLQAGALLPVQELIVSGANSSDDPLYMANYAAAGASFARYIRETYGMEALQELCEIPMSAPQGATGWRRDCEAAFHAAVGFPLQQVELGWHTRLRGFAGLDEELAGAYCEAAASLNGGLDLALYRAVAGKGIAVLDRFVGPSPAIMEALDGIADLNRQLGGDLMPLVKVQALALVASDLALTLNRLFESWGIAISLYRRALDLDEENADYRIAALEIAAKHYEEAKDWAMAEEVRSLLAETR